ncbi:MAG: permease prefix domain 2-containing transporter [Marinoscillum sp.]
MKPGDSNPPRLPLQFLRWFCDPELLEDVEGDLFELFVRRLDRRPAWANLIFYIDVLVLFRPGVIRSFEGRSQLNGYGMFKNYLVASWRNLMKNKRFSAINIFSLTLGIAACMIVYLFVQEEQAFDGFHRKKDHIFRLCEVQSFPG